MKRILAIVTAALLTVTLTACDKAKDAGGKPEQKGEKAAVKETKAPEGKAQTSCPVMGGQIVKTIYADHDGKRVYFCCAGCETKFKQDPAKYIKEMEEKGIVLAKTPAEKK
jgi:YHS domain-containing protein